jgi:predicted metal-dependent hydrolase
MSLPIHIERTRNRSSRAILRDGELFIRLAGRLSAQAEREHIDILTRRMAKAHAREVLKHRIEPFRQLLTRENSELIIETCTGYRIHFTVTEGHKTQSKRTVDGWSVTRSPTISEKVFHRYLWKLLEISMEVEIAKLVREINARTLKVPIRSITLKFMRSRWGSCSHSGNIALSTPLLCTSKEILEYVIIHELAHVREMNHSKRFWAIVEEYCPEYREQMKALKGYRVIRER